MDDYHPPLDLTPGQWDHAERLARRMEAFDREGMDQLLDDANRFWGFLIAAVIDGAAQEMREQWMLYGGGA